MDPRYSTADPTKFWERAIPSEGCWLWDGVVNRANGYSQYLIRVDGTVFTLRAHTWSYLLHHGPVPDGLEIDHLCRTRECVRPDHLEAVSHLENMQRSPFAGGRPRIKVCEDAA